MDGSNDMTNPQDTPVLTAPEAVRYLRLDILTKPDGTEHRREMADAIKSLDHLVRNGRIPYIRLGKNRRFPRDYLDQYIEANTSWGISE